MRKNNNKKILLLMHSMHGYAREFINELRLIGYHVEWYQYASKLPSSRLGFYGSFIKYVAKKTAMPLYARQMQAIERYIYRKDVFSRISNYDCVLSIGGACSEFFAALLKEYTDKEKILFVWDDLKLDERTNNIVDCFDRVYSYSIDDAEKYKLEYVPNFYLNIFSYSGQSKNIDVSYVGGFRSLERLRQLEYIDRCLDGVNKYFKVYARKSEISKYSKNIRSEYMKYIISNPVDIDNLSKIYKESKVLLDLPLEDQVGLGLRPIEALASKCKLITTNRHILKYDFYNESNIYVLSDTNIDVGKLKRWLDIPYQKYDESLLCKYRIDSFIRNIIE